ncbi:MAG: hypothetical protein ACYSTI_10575 [Planctomycetota bacterium]|jgi:FtsZ-binding cell division protein ZapB
MKNVFLAFFVFAFVFASLLATNLSTKSAKLQEENTALAATVEEAQSNIHSLEEEVARIEGQRSELRDAANDLRDEKKDLQEELRSLKDSEDLPVTKWEFYDILKGGCQLSIGSLVDVSQEAIYEYCGMFVQNMEASDLYQRYLDEPSEQPPENPTVPDLGRP